MTNFHFITYATHSEGTFEELINNKFNIPIKVLGWGKKWNGFMDKFKNIYKYIQTLPENDIVIFIDGFDSKINQNIDVIKEKFYEFNSDIVLSENPYNNYVMKKIFGVCKNNLIANSGLYAGYNNKVQELLNHILTKNYTSDDQTSLNLSCKEFHNIRIDNSKKLFHNLNLYDRYFHNNFDSCFISTPGKLSFKRIIRMPGEYIQFLWKDILMIILTIIFTILYYNKFEYNIYDCNIITTYMSYFILTALLLNTTALHSILFIIFLFTWHSLHHYYKIKNKNF